MRHAKKFIIVITMICLLSPAVSALAAHPKKVKELVEPYVEAFKEYNKSEIRKAFNDISSDPEVVSYISENMPDTYRLYNAWVLVERAEALNERYGNQNIADDYVPAESVISDSTTGAGYPSNRSVSRSLRNQKLPSNQSRISNASINNNSISNSQIGRNFPISRQISNRDRIRASQRRR